MLGPLLVLVSTICLALSDCGKKILTRSYSPSLINFIPVTIGWIAQSVFLLATRQFPPLDIVMVFPFLCATVIVMVSIEVLFVKAIAQSDLSLSLPFTSFVPLFAAVGSWVLLREAPSLLSFGGVFVVMIGAWIILRDPNSGFWAPFALLFRSAGPRLILFSAMLNGILYPLLKVGGDLATPAWFFTFMLMGESLVFGAFLIQERCNPLKLFRAQPGLAIGTAVLWTLGLGALNSAIGIMYVAHATALQRLHLLWIVLLGHFFFGEPGFRQRLLGVAVMLGGVVWIVLV